MKGETVVAHVYNPSSVCSCTIKIYHKAVSIEYCPLHWSAPKLFAALRLCVARLEEYGDAKSGIALEIAREAIAKAKGLA